MRLGWLKTGAADVEQQQAVGTFMETLAVHAQMLCWPLHTGDRTEEEAKTN